MQDNEDFNTDSNPDSGSETFGTPPNLTPAKEGGDWDNPKRVDVSTLESDAWKQDPDMFDSDKAVDFEDVEAEVGDKPAEAEVQKTEQEPPQDEPRSPRENDRIRQLVDERKQADERASALERKIEALLNVQHEQTRLQKQLYQEEVDRRANAEKQRKEAEFLEQLKNSGFDETNPAHWLSLQAFQEAKQLREQNAKALETYKNRDLEASYRAYERQLASELTKSLTDPSTGKEIVDEATRNALYTAAYSLARAERIANPSDAVKRIVAPIVSTLTKPRTTKRPSPEDPTHKAIATSGRAAGKSPGSSASGKKPLARDVLAFLK